MAAPFETLPNELLDSIVEPLKDDPRSLSYLLQSSKNLHPFIENRLYNNAVHRDWALYHACKNGNTATIRLCVAYGASPTTLYRPTSNRNPETAVAVTEVNSLDKVLKHGHFDAFRVLVELGATLNTDNQRRRHKTLLSRFCRSNSDDHQKLRQFFISGISNMVNIPMAADRCVVPAILAGASPETIDVLLQHGADLNRSETTKRFRQLCPLSAAAVIGSNSVFNLLLERGAKLHAKRHLKAAVLPYRVPLLAAASYMARTGSTEIFDQCLRLGAPITTAVHTRAESDGGRRIPRITRYPASALTVYVNDVSFCGPLQPLDGVRHILGQHVPIDGLTGALQDGHNPLLHHDPAVAKHAMEHLLKKYNPKWLAIDKYYAVIEFLADRSPRSNPKPLLKLYDMSNILPPPEDERFRTRWRKIFETIL